MRHVRILSALAFTALAPGAWAMEGLAQYDTFNQQFIDGTRWLNGEVSVQAKGGALHMSDVIYANQTQSFGYTYRQIPMILPHPDPVTEMQLNVTINSIGNYGCPNSETASFSRFVMSLVLFNQTGTVYGNSTNDVLAQIRVERRSDSTDGPNVVQLYGILGTCLDAGCAGVNWGAPVDLGKSDLGFDEQIEIQWNQPKKQVIFTRTSGPRQVVDYTWADNFAPGRDIKGIATFLSVDNCVGSVLPAASIDATIDNVMLNKSAVK
jgi:hypothetical protein